jgi:hypothetical protein
MRIERSTRIVALLLTVLGIVPGALAIKPSHTGPSVEATVRTLNELLHSDPNFAELYCSNTAELTLSPNHKEIVVTYWLIDKHGKIRPEIPPQYIYRIQVAAVDQAYAWGPWTTKDRVMVTTRGKAILKVGPMWDCFRNKPKAPKQSMRNNIPLLVFEADDKRLYRIADAFKHLVEVLKTEPPPKPETGTPAGADSGPEGPPRLAQPKPERKAGKSP